MVDGRIEVLAPASISDAALQGHIEKLRARLEKRVYPRDDAHLQERAGILNRRYFQGSLNWNSIRYSSNQERTAGLLQQPQPHHPHQQQACRPSPVG